MYKMTNIKGISRTNLNTSWVLFVFLLVLFTFNATANAQYEITWSTIDGGGGRSTGGTYTLEGTIGQPDAGLLSGGDYVLAGGFWPATSWCIVDLPDLATFCNFWLIGSGAPQGDFNNNGHTDLYDFNHLATYWLRMCPDTWPWW
ncbi:MAG: hypothetical protein GY869_09885 [Planctomycetes bacterium]|nr:hypothetical protein [Planctomycetota bacterium]